MALARKSDGGGPPGGTGQDCSRPAWRANGTMRLVASSGRCQIRWVCGARASRQLGWPGCGIGRGLARPPNMALNCSCQFCANWNCCCPRGWPVGRGLPGGSAWCLGRWRPGALGRAGKVFNCGCGVRGGVSTDLQFTTSAADIIGLYLNPPGKRAGLLECRREADDPGAAASAPADTS